MQSVTLPTPRATAPSTPTIRPATASPSPTPKTGSGYTYDSAGQLTAFTSPDGDTTGFTHDPADGISATIRPNNTRTNYSCDAAGQVTRIENLGSGGTISSFDYQYDLAGNRTVQTEEDGAVTTYRYDALYRLTKVTYPLDKSSRSGRPICPKPRRPRCQGANPCLGSNPCLGTNLCRGTNPCQGVKKTNNKNRRTKATAKKAISGPPPPQD